MNDASSALARLWSQAGGDPAALERVTLTGADPVLPTDFKIGTAAAATIAATGLAASEVWRLRTGRAQSVAVDARVAVAAFKSERYLRVNGRVPDDPRGEIFGFHRASDGRWIQLHGAFPHHRAAIMRVVGCTEDRREMADARVVRRGRPLRQQPAPAEHRSARDGHRPRQALGFRQGALAQLGFSPEEVAKLRPGIVYMTLSAYSHMGPWRDRRGFETLVQSVSGMAHEQGFGGGLEKPQHLPAQVVDHGTGYLGAFGVLVALARRAREGGSWLVRVSLAQTGRWVDGLGRVDGRKTPDLALTDIDDLLADMDTPFGRLRYVTPAARFSETPAVWSRPAVPLGTHAAAWLA